MRKPDAICSIARALPPGLIVGALLCQAAATLAADADVPLGETVVTATKTETAVADAPAAVTVVTEKAIAERNVSRVTDALAQVPGLHMSSPMNGQMSQGVGGGMFTLRGMNASRTAVLVDGKPLVDGFSSKVDFRSVLTDDVARVEVVPGAFSSLYGSNAIGGVINIITKEPDRRELSVRLRQGYGDAAGEDLNVYFRDKFESGLGIAAGFGYQDRDGYVNEFVTRTPAAGTPGAPVTGAIATTTSTGARTYIVGDKGPVPWRQANGTVKLSYDLSPRSKLYGGLAYSDYQTGVRPYNTYLRDANGNPVSSGTLAIDGRRISLADTAFATSAPQNNGDRRYHGGFEGIVGHDYKLKLELAKSHKTNWYDTNTTGTWSGGPGTVTDTPSETVDGIAQLSFPLGASQFLVTGLSLRQSSLDRRVYNLANWRNPDSKTALSDGASGDSTTVSLFAQDEISVSDAWTLYAGGRVDRWETKGSNFKLGAGAYSNAFASRSETAFSPKLSAVFKASRQVTLRASAGRSFRAPDNYELYGTLYCCNTYYYSNPQLKPETATTWEFGGDWMPTADLKGTVSVYETRLKDMIYGRVLATTTAPGTQPDRDRVNAGEARVRGIELSALARLAAWLDLNLVYSYVDSSILKNEADPLTVGKRIAYTPKNLMTVGVSTHLGPWVGLLETKFTGRAYSTEQNTDSVDGVFGSQGSYTMTNLKVSYRIDKSLKASLAINNLSDAKVYQYYLLPGRNATAELDISF